jgi:hypothetical protein
MAITTRQNSLIVAEDWTKIYQTFKEADFQSYDFETLRKSMVDYLRLYYPEDFNDFIDSSEFIALIDLIAFLGQGLAFRGDLNARENFIDTAERRESILKLAKLINYSPKRNIPASGLLKISSIRTTEPVYDSDGINLAGLTINWNDRTNPSWQEQFITVINTALTNSQRVGRSGNSTTINGVRNDEYELNLSSTRTTPVFPFTATADGYSLPFELVSATAINSLNLYESSPKPSSAFNILSRNDKLGNGSNNTGFFMYFKQGTLDSQSFNITEATPNRVVSINVPGINNSDVWLYQLDADGVPSDEWEHVPTVGGSNIAYNALSQTNRKVFQVVSKANDQIDLVFGDGVFAEIPKGNFVVYYRTSAGINYKITPDEMQGVTVSINYTSKRGRNETLTVTANLEYTVTNASARETLDEIKQKAPQQYYTQNRIVTGEDYNIFPFTQFNNIVKVKSVNRTSSGISRYLDVIDSTGKYSSTNIYGSDGWFYRNEETDNFTFSYSNSNDILRVIRQNINSLLVSKEFTNFYYEKFTHFDQTDLEWKQLTTGTNICTGYFVDGSDNPQQIGDYVASERKYIKPGSLLRIEAPTGYYFNKNNYLRQGTPTGEGERVSFYTSVKAVIDDGTNQGAGALTDGTGPVTFNDIVPTNSIVTKVVAPFATSLTSTIEQSILENVNLKRDFGLRYDIETQEYKIITSDNLNKTGEFSLDNAGDETSGGLDSSWTIYFETNGLVYTVRYRTMDFVFESKYETRFYYDPDVRVFDSSTGQTITDFVNIMGINAKPDSTEAIGVDQFAQIHGVFTEDDGYKDSTKIKVTYPDSDNDGIPDDIDLFNSVVDPDTNPTNKYVFFKNIVDVDGYTRKEPVDVGVVNTEYATQAEINSDIVYFNDGQIFFATDEEEFYILVVDGITRTLPLLESETGDVYSHGIGRGGIKFQYRHNSPNDRRIDPSPGNIIDMYVLTKVYDEDLRVEFSEIENYKPVSDTILFSSAKFKPLFGEEADSTLRAIFKVVKSASSTVSDSEVKSMMISAINRYFSLENWDFGETFYFSELSTYLHRELTPHVASIVLVPTSENQTFGSMYQVNCDPDEIFVSAATVDNIQIISAVTASQLNQL